MRPDYLLLGGIVLVLLIVAGGFYPGELGSGQSITVPAASRLEVQYLKSGQTSGEVEFTCYNNNPGAQMDDRVTFGSTNCCTNPSQPCYPTCTMSVTDTNNLCRGTITYAGNEGFEYAYYKINGCWVGSIGKPNPEIMVSNCQLVIGQSEEPGDSEPSGNGTYTKTVFQLFIELIQGIISRIMNIFG